MKYCVASDHAGVALKAFVGEWLCSEGFEVKNLGTDTEERVDYPFYAQKLVQVVLQNQDYRGILICGSGIGMSIAANRFDGIRAALCHDSYTAELARRHNNANVLCLGARVLGLGVVEAILRSFIYTDFEGGRHINRIEQIEFRSRS